MDNWIISRKMVRCNLIKNLIGFLRILPDIDCTCSKIISPPDSESAASPFAAGGDVGITAGRFGTGGVGGIFAGGLGGDGA
jgi:hypothetical protein